MEPSTDLIKTIFFEYQEMDEKMKILLSYCNNILSTDVTETARYMYLKLLLIIVTGIDNVSQNILIEYLIVHSQFDAFINLLRDSSLRAKHGHDVVILLTILVNYRKHEATNPYVVQLSILADELALNG